MKSEAEILREIRLALGQIPGCDFQRLSQVQATMGGRTVRGGLCPGAADLIGCVKGRFVALEVKTDAGRLSPEQALWHERMRRVGAVVEVVRSAEDAVSVVTTILRETRP